MKEQSHKDEMSAALRGDFQRLRARGVSATLVPHESAAHAPEPAVDEAAVRAEEPAPAVDPSHASAQAVVRARRSRRRRRPAAEPSPTPDEAPGSPGLEPGEEPAAPRSGWLSRLVGR